MANQLLVSFCNFEHERPSGLLWVQLDPLEMAWVIPASVPRVHSCTGLLQNSNQIYFTGHRDTVGFVGVLDAQDFSLVSFDYPENLRDPHSLAWYRDALHISNTGRDEVVKIELPSENLQLEPIWQAGSERSDLHHLNGLGVRQNELLCCGFGERPPEGWREAHHGKVINVSNLTDLAQDLIHPHSLTTGADGTLYWCESRPGFICRSCDQKRVEVSGYTRGLCLLDMNTGWVGLSKGRTRSKSTGVALPAVKDLLQDRCGLAHYDFRTGCISDFIDLSAFGREIYDILPLTERPPTAVLTQWREQAQVYAVELEESLREARVWGGQLDREVNSLSTKFLEERSEVIKRTAWAEEQEKIASERLHWAKKQESELSSTTAKFATLQNMFDERSAWCVRLNEELESTQAAFAEARDQAAGHLEWARKLESELTPIQTAFSALQQSFEERSKWSLGLDEELKSTQQAFADAQGLAENRLEWARNLESELEATRTEFQNLQQAAAEREAWAVKLNEELEVAQRAVAKLNSQLSTKTEDEQQLAQQLLDSEAALRDLKRRCEAETDRVQALEDQLEKCRDEIARKRPDDDSPTAQQGLQRLVAKELDAVHQQLLPHDASEQKLLRPPWNDLVENAPIQSVSLPPPPKDDRDTISLRSITSYVLWLKYQLHQAEYATSIQTDRYARLSQELASTKGRLQWLEAQASNHFATEPRR